MSPCVPRAESGEGTRPRASGEGRVNPASGQSPRSTVALLGDGLGLRRPSPGATLGKPSEPKLYCRDVSAQRRAVTKDAPAFSARARAFSARARARVQRPRSASRRPRPRSASAPAQSPSQGPGATVCEPCRTSKYSIGPARRRRRCRCARRRRRPARSSRRSRRGCRSPCSSASPWSRITMRP